MSGEESELQYERNGVVRVSLLVFLLQVKLERVLFVVLGPAVLPELEMELWVAPSELTQGGSSFLARTGCSL